MTVLLQCMGSLAKYRFASLARLARHGVHLPASADHDQILAELEKLDKLEERALSAPAATAA